MQKVEIVKIDSDGVGVARIDNKPVLIGKVLPQEIVTIDNIVDRGKYMTADCVDVVMRSSERVLPKCPYYLYCDACNLQHASDDFEQKYKIDIVKQALKHVAGLDVTINTFVNGTETFGYRNKIVFAVHDGSIGMYRKGTHDLVAIDMCMLISKELNNFISNVTGWLQEAKPDLNHIAFRQIGDKFQCVLIAMDKPHSVDKLLAVLDVKYAGCYQIVYNHNDGIKDLITNDLTVLAGDVIYDNFLGIQYPVSANSFLQVNREVSEKLYSAVSQLASGDVVINAYSGAGVLSAILASSAKKVYGVEIVKNASDNAEELKKANNIDNMYNLCGKSEVLIPKILQKEKKLTLVVDPPRKGLDAGLTKYINNTMSIDKVIYVACSPNSLARDIRNMSNYRIKHISLYNMFPQTNHVETLVELVRK